MDIFDQSRRLRSRDTTAPSGERGRSEDDGSGAGQRRPAGEPTELSDAPRAPDFTVSPPSEPPLSDDTPTWAGPEPNKDGRGAPRALDPAQAFTFWMSLPVPERTYRAVSEQFGASIASVGRMAVRHDWLAEARRLEVAAAQRVDSKLIDSLAEANRLHIEALRGVLTKSIEALEHLDPVSFPEAVRGIEMAIKTERLVRGESTDNAKLTVADQLKRHFADLLELPEPSRPAIEVQIGAGTDE